MNPLDEELISQQTGFVKVTTQGIYYNLFARQLPPREGPKVTLRENRDQRSSNALRLPSGNRGYVAEEGL